MIMKNKIFSIATFILCCNLNIQSIHSTQDFLFVNRDSYVDYILVDESLIAYENEYPFYGNNNPSFYVLSECSECPSGYCDELGCIDDMDPDHPDPGKTPVGGGFGFLIFSSFLYGLRCFYKKKKK